ncbi:hypothetical protein QFW80_00105 [Luteimonas sp. M1R5S18]|uniref:Uncharacterized protein n=1 Tax=Luteimonas rhizosphaericola TaxID=3042024 RepID=A0ABT6JE22_9GAMM|nr:hypothetical protein [Luteimonas rhizosphaericola]MDH5828926.1 hypothetical protein [Luteimonas rhizosphaericola]
MNWKLIAKYVLCLLLAHFTIGLLEGLFTPASFGVDEGLRYFFMAMAAYLSASAIVFFTLSARHPQGRWAQATLVFLVYAVLSLAIDLVSSIWLPSTPIVLSAIGWLAVAVCALLGTVGGALFAARAAVVAPQTSRHDA